MINELLKLAELLDSLNEETSADKVGQLAVTAQMLRAPQKPERSNEGYKGLPGGLELDDEREFGYPDPERLVVPDAEDLDVQEREQVGGVSTNWVELGEALGFDWQEWVDGGDAGDPFNETGFRFYLMDEGVPVSVDSLPDKGYHQFDRPVEVKDIAAADGATLSWKRILELLEDFKKVTKRDLDQNRDRYSSRDFIEGFISYSPPDGKEKKVANFRNFERKTRPMAGAPGSAGAEEVGAQKHTEAVIQTVGEFADKPFEAMMTLEDVLKKSPMEGKLYGEVDQEYLPDLFPEEGQAVPNEIPVGGPNELSRLWRDDSYEHLFDDPDELGVNDLGHTVTRPAKRTSPNRHMDSDYEEPYDPSDYEDENWASDSPKKKA